MGFRESNASAPFNSLHFLLLFSPSAEELTQKTSKEENDKETDESLYTEKSSEQREDRVQGAGVGGLIWMERRWRQAGTQSDIWGTQGCPGAGEHGSVPCLRPFSLPGAGLRVGCTGGLLDPPFVFCSWSSRENRSDFLMSPLWDSPGPTAAFPSPKLTFHPPSVALKIKHLETWSSHPNASSQVLPTQLHSPKGLSEYQLEQVLGLRNGRG